MEHGGGKKTIAVFRVSLLRLHCIYCRISYSNAGLARKPRRLPSAEDYAVESIYDMIQ